MIPLDMTTNHHHQSNSSGSDLDAAFKAPLTTVVMEDIKNFTDLMPKRSIAVAFSSEDNG